MQAPAALYSNEIRPSIAATGIILLYDFIPNRLSEPVYQKG
ncbi:MAG: hypothetical protein AB1861_12605 [Cyanobacteriota bacterium]